jgi:hypothetical protein
MSALADLGIDGSTCPPGTVRLLKAEEYRHFDDVTFKWSLNPNNDRALAYEIETEHKRGVGVILRNLHREKAKKGHRTVVTVEPPLWHNFSPSLPKIWETGVAVLVEGPKDARVLHQEGIQAVAYLGAAPTSKHLKIMARYASVIIWIPDNEPLDPAVVRRREQVMEFATQHKLIMRQIKLPCKDAGELVDHPDYIPVLKSLVEEASLFNGGGYKGATKGIV